MTDWETTLSEQARIRRAKLYDLKNSGQDPYAITSFPVTHQSADIITRYEDMEGKTVTIAGRVIAQRIMGKASFAHILDSDGKMQIYARRDDIGQDNYDAFKSMDLGDIIGVTGHVFKTRTGEVSVHAAQITLLAKALLPLPEKFHGLKDNDLRYRMRYVDLIVNPEVREAFVRRSRLLALIRREMDALGYLEVDTPVLHNKATNSAARPFMTHHNTLDIDMFLRVETELALKRLIVGGMGRVYEIGRIFRNEGMDRTHNPEFTTIEMYEAYADYKGMMALAERLYLAAANEICGGPIITYQGTELNFTPPFARITMTDAVKKYAGIDFDAIDTDEEAYAAITGAGMEPPKGLTRGELIAYAFDERCESRLIQPTFVCDYPIEISPLAKKTPGDPRLVERFELFICGSEGANAFSELNDPIDQRERFTRQAQLKNPEGKFEVDEDFLTAIEYGMPPTGGMGIGIDRMAMLFSDSASIRDVLLFPTMKPRDS